MDHKGSEITVRRLLPPLALVIGSTLFAFTIIEMLLRASYLQDPWTARNFTVDPVNQQVTNLAITYDPVLGYIARPGMRDGRMHSHGEMGIRVNRTLRKGEANPPLPRGGVLAVGDSFTFGSEVADADSWPAQLEKMTGIPVVNAGAGGYGIDQAILRAEQLLDLVAPSAIVVSFIPDNVGRNEYSVNGGLIKPYFAVVNGRLELQNVPVPAYQPSRAHIGRLRKVFGYSYAIFWAADRLGLGKRWQVYEGEVRREHKEGVEVSCLLWQRLADKVNGRNVRLIALAQYAGIQINGHYKARESFQVERILDCARSAGFTVVDSYGELRRRFEADEKSFWRLWVRQPHDKNWHTGHMSVEGNRVTAQLLAESIGARLAGLPKQ